MGFQAGVVLVVSSAPHVRGCPEQRGVPAGSGRLPAVPPNPTTAGNADHVTMLGCLDCAAASSPQTPAAFFPTAQVPAGRETPTRQGAATPAPPVSRRLTNDGPGVPAGRRWVLTRATPCGHGMPATLPWVIASARHAPAPRRQRIIPAPTIPCTALKAVLARDPGPDALDQRQELRPPYCPPPPPSIEEFL